MRDEYLVEPSGIASRYYTEEDGEEESVRIYLDGLDGGPDAVLCRHSDGARAEPHFHHGSQFQLMLRGETEFSDHLLTSPAVHYTDHNTAYGPFTMRKDHQMLVLHARPAGQVFIKDILKDRAAREKLNRAGRQISGSASEASWEPVPGHPGVRRKMLIPESEGPCVQLVECPPNAELNVGPTRFGRFELIADGTASLEGKPLESKTLRFVRGTRAFAPLRAGARGATVIVLSFDEDAAKGEMGGISIAGRLAMFRQTEPDQLKVLRAAAE
jgi:hypothetical protein